MLHYRDQSGSFQLNVEYHYCCCTKGFLSMVWRKEESNLALVCLHSSTFFKDRAEIIHSIPYKETFQLITPCQNGFLQKVGNQAQECPNHDIWCLRVQENHELKSSHSRIFFAQTFRKLGPESNPGPLDLKSTALPTDPRREEISGPKIQIYQHQVLSCMTCSYI